MRCGGRFFVGMLAIYWVALSFGAAAGASQFPQLESLPDHLLSSQSKDGIPALTNPRFIAADAAEYLLDTDLVLGVEVNGEARAYPHNLGWWHEIINDRIGDQAIAVTLCPLTSTGLVFNTTDADGTQFELGFRGC